MAKDLTNCNPATGLLKYAVPLILGNVFQQLYNLVDSIIVGNYCGADALAAVGASTAIIQLFLCISIGGSVGASVIIAQMFGAKQYGRMMTAIKTSLLTFCAVGALLMAAGTLLNRPLLHLMSTPENVFDDAALYMRIYFYGFLFMMMFNGFNAVFNALGDSKVPLIFLAISAVLNVGLNILFITEFGMEVDGVAWATVISQGVAVLLTLLVLIFKLRKLHITEPSSLFDKGILKTVCVVAGPSCLQQSIVAIGLLFIQSVVNGFGSVAMAGYTAANKIDMLAILPMSNMGNAVSTFTAQNIGAKKHERIPKGLKAGIISVVIIGLVIAAILFVFGESLVSLFVSGEGVEEVVREGANYLKTSSCFYFVFGAMNSCCGVLRGAGDMKGFMLAYLANFGVRVIISYTIAVDIGLGMVAWSTVIGWASGLVLGAIRYKTGKWKTKKLI